jgi:hypothetical protein
MERSPQRRGDLGGLRAVVVRNPCSVALDRAEAEFDGVRAAERGGRTLRVCLGDDADWSGPRGLRGGVGAVWGDGGAAGESDGFDTRSAVCGEWNAWRGDRFQRAGVGDGGESNRRLVALE